MLHRRSIRYGGYDYSSEGAYFVTLVTHQRESLFGNVIDGVMQLNNLGRIVWEEWFKSAILRPNIEFNEDEFVVMPNHIHGIIWITEPGKNLNSVGLDKDTMLDCPGKGTARRALTTGQFGQPIPNSLPTVVGAYKSAVTKRINLLRRTPGKPVWLRNYYEHIIETEREYNNIANYIHDNPVNWGTKDEYFT